MDLVLQVVLILLLVLGGGGGYYYGGPIIGSGVGGILLIVLIVWLLMGKAQNLIHAPPLLCRDSCILRIAESSADSTTVSCGKQHFNIPLR